MFQNHKQNTIRQNNSEHNNEHPNNTHPNNRQSSHHKTHHHPPHGSHHNSPCPTRLIFSTQKNTTPASHRLFSFTHTPCPTAPRQEHPLPHKQTDSNAAALEGSNNAPILQATPASHRPFSFTHTPCPTAPRQEHPLPHKQTDSNAAALEGLSKSQAHWQSKRFGNDEPTKKR